MLDINVIDASALVEGPVSEKVSVAAAFGFELGSTFRYISGNPYTPVVGRVYDADYDMYRPVYGETNSGRNPAFYQWDLRIERVWKRGWGSVAAYLDVQNATNRRNPEGRFYNYDYTRDRTVPGLPIIPSLGMETRPRVSINNSDGPPVA